MINMLNIIQNKQTRYLQTILNAINLISIVNSLLKYLVFSRDDIVLNVRCSSSVMSSTGIPLLVIYYEVKCEPVCPINLVTYSISIQNHKIKYMMTMKNV